MIINGLFWLGNYVNLLSNERTFSCKLIKLTEKVYHIANKQMLYSHS